MEDTPKPLFAASITDGYSFRNTINTILNEATTVAMILTPNSIEIPCVNFKQYAMYNIHIKTPKLSDYYYGAVDEEGEYLESYTIYFDIEEFFKAVKNLGRKDSIQMYLMPGEQRLCIHLNKSNIKNNVKAAAVFVKLINSDITRFTIPDVGNKEPNIRIPVKAFSDLCVQASTMKCTHVEIIYNDREFKFQGRQSDKNICFIERYESTANNRSPSDNRLNNQYLDSLLENVCSLDIGVSDTVFNLEEDNIVRVPISTIKSISKLHNISGLGTMLQFYYEPGKPIKITSPIGSYGTYTICLRDDITK